MDDLFPGWQGLRAGVAKVADTVVGPLGRGETGGYRRYDWVADAEAEWVEVRAVDLLVLEGCGSGSATYASSVTSLVWVEVPAPVRLARGIARDGEDLRHRWLVWMADEEVLFTDERTRERADLVVVGSDADVSDADVAGD